MKHVTVEAMEVLTLALVTVVVTEVVTEVAVTLLPRRWNMVVTEVLTVVRIPLQL